MYTYLEIVKTKTEEVVKRIDVSDKSERSIERTENGMNINLNHSEYHTNEVKSETELPKI